MWIKLIHSDLVFSQGLKTSKLFFSQSSRVEMILSFLDISKWTFLCCYNIDRIVDSSWLTTVSIMYTYSHFVVSLTIVFWWSLIFYTAFWSMFLQIHSIRSLGNGENPLHTIFKTSVFKRCLNLDPHSYFCHVQKHLCMCPGNHFFWNCREGAELS